MTFNRSKPNDQKFKIAFICTENANRSQIAEGFATRYASELSGDISVYSAGSKPSGTVNPKAMSAMSAIGYDISAQTSTSIDELPEGPIDLVVTMGCGDACPNLDAKRRVEWEFADPRDMDESEYFAVRDQIGEKVEALMNQMVKELNNYA